LFVENLLRKFQFDETVTRITALYLKVKVNQSLYGPEVPRGFQEVKVPELRDNGPTLREDIYKFMIMYR